MAQVSPRVLYSCRQLVPPGVPGLHRPPWVPAVTPLPQDFKDCDTVASSMTGSAQGTLKPGHPPTSVNWALSYLPTAVVPEKAERHL